GRHDVGREFDDALAQLAVDNAEIGADEEHVGVAVVQVEASHADGIVHADVSPAEAIEVAVQGHAFGRGDVGFGGAGFKQGVRADAAHRNACKDRPLPEQTRHGLFPYEVGQAL